MAVLPLETLQSPAGVMDVIVYLAGRECEYATKASSEMKMHRTRFYACIKKLLHLRLAFERKEKGFPPRTYYGLTSKGREWAERLQKLVPLVKESVEKLRKELEELERAEMSKKNVKRQIEIIEMFLEESYHRGEWDEALKLAERIGLLASEIRDKARAPSSELWIGKVLQKKNDDACMAHLDAAYRDGLSTGQLDVAAEAAYMRGCYLERRTSFGKAEKEFRVCEDLAKKAKSNLNLGRARLGRGRVLVEKGLHSRAKEKLREALSLLEGEGDVEELQSVYANMGAASFNEDAKEALEWHEKAVRACELGGFIRLLSFELLNAAGCLQKLGDSRQAKRFMKRAEDLAEEIDDPKLSASVFIQSAYIKSGIGELDDAEEVVRKAIEVAKKNKMMRELANAYYLLGDILRELRREKEATRALEDALALFRRLKDEGMTQRLVSELANLRK
jgi:tetratricopeptide (TPR) repeat protein